MPKLTVLGAALALVLAIPAGAQEPPGATFAPAPPGAVVQSQLVYLAGEAMHSQWRAVASKREVGASGGETFYQWYLSIYAIDGTTYRLKYQSPGNGGPLSRVEKANGASMWFPAQSLQITGAAELMQPGVQQLVVASHETGADCGSATVSVFATDGHGNVVPAVSLQNGCDLRPTIVHGSKGDTLRLDGPYYAADAPMCCPTKPKASAVLRYAGGKWTLTPPYYQLFVGKLPPE
ncbi:MAG TPA: hypothetical protein VMH02_02050 [Verrucomicrobiae bacterium]|nr:hypothetical protein [Verrucomicrobiae bacterium]